MTWSLCSCGALVGRREPVSSCREAGCSLNPRPSPATIVLSPNMATAPRLAVSAMRPPARPLAVAATAAAGEQVVGQQQDSRARDGGEPGGEVEESVQGDHVEQLCGQPAAEQRPGDADHAGQDEAL